MLSLFRQVKHELGETTNYFTTNIAVPEQFYYRKYIYRENDQFVTKTRTHVKTYGALHKKFDEFNSINAITQALEYCWDHPELCCIYGKLVDTYDVLIPETDRKLQGIRLTSTDSTGKAVFDEHAHSNLIAFDIDGIDYSGDNTDLSAIGRYISSILTNYNESIFPEGFGYVVKPSGSAGFKPGIRVHFFCLNDEKLSKRQYQKFIQALNNDLKREKIVENDFADGSIYKILSQFYLAQPKYGPGLTSPFGDGYPFVTVQGKKCSIPVSIEHYVPSKKQTMPENMLEELFDFEGFRPNDQNIDLELKRRLNSIAQANDGLAFGSHGSARTDLIFAIHISISNLYDFEYMRDYYFLPVIEQYIRNKTGTNTEFSEEEQEALLKRYFIPAWNFVASDACNSVSRIITSDVHPGAIVQIKNPNNGYLDLPPREEEKIQFWKASLGTGKTYTVRKDWADGITNQVLVVSSKRSLLGVVASSFEAIHYEDLDPMTVTKEDLEGKNLVCCINSLSKFKHVLPGFEYVFVDECEDVRKNIINASTFRDVFHRLDTIDTLAEVMLKSKYCVLADGDMTNDTIEFYMDITKGLKPADVFITKVQTHKGVEVYLHDALESVHKAILDELDEGMKVLVVGDFGDEEAVSLQEYIKSHCKKELPDVDPKIITIHGKLGDEHVNRHLLKSGKPTEYLKRQKPDVLITTPVITNGVDIQGYFDVIVSIVNSQVNSPSERLQAICRERNPLEKKIHLYTSKGCETKWVAPNVIQKAIDSIEGEESPYTKARIQDQFRYYNERSKYRWFMVYGLIEKGAKVKVYNYTKGDKQYRELRKQAKKQVHDIKCEQLTLLETYGSLPKGGKFNAETTIEELLTPRDGLLVVKAIRALFDDERYHNITVGELASVYGGLSMYSKARAYLLLSHLVPEFFKDMLALGKTSNLKDKQNELRLLIIKYHSDLMANGLISFFDKDHIQKTLATLGFTVQKCTVQGKDLITGWFPDLVAEDAKKLEPLFFEIAGTNTKKEDGDEAIYEL